MATLAFFVTLALQLAAVTTALKGRSPRRRRAGRAFVVASVAPVAALLGSSLVAVAAIAAAVGTWIADPQGAEGPLPRMSRPGFVQVGAFALLVFVLIGTLARQVVTYGATASERPDFGVEGPTLDGLMRLAWPALGLMLLLAMLFVARARLTQEDV
jgi:hypothetical protein